MSPRLRDEGGAILWPVLGIVLVFGGLGSVFISAAQESVAREEPAEPVAAIRLATVADHAPPSDAFQNECVMRVASRYGLTWETAAGWTAADYPRPQLSGGTGAAARRADRALATEWENDTRARVQLAAADWQHCLAKPAPDSGAPQVAQRDPRELWAGTWYLRRTSDDPYADTNAGCPLPSTVTVAFENGTAPIATFTFAGKLPEKAEQVSTYQYEHEAGNTQNGLRFEVGLLTIDRQDAISGQIHDNGSGTYLCSVSFDGFKTPSSGG